MRKGSAILSALSARVGFWLALVAAGAAAGMWFMWGQVHDARQTAQAAQLRADELGKQLDELAKRQALTDATLATRRRHSNDLQTQLAGLRSDLEKVIRDDPQSSAWADECLPSAIADRMRAPADPRCP